MPQIAGGVHESGLPPVEFLIRYVSPFQKLRGDRLQTKMKQHNAVNIVISIWYI
jgi:hypothetical protein